MKVIKRPEEIINNAIEHWRLNKGIGTVLIPKLIDDRAIILGILQRLYSKNLSIKTMILVNTYHESCDILEYLTHQPDSEENNNTFKNLIDHKNIRVISYDYYKYISNDWSNICILYRYDTIYPEVSTFAQKCKFRLVVLNKLSDNPIDREEIYKLAPLLEDFKQQEIEQLRLSIPVEEHQIGVSIPKDSEDYKLITKYNEYIATSINIFGSLDIIQQAAKGNTQLNISAIQICNQIAKENGWHDHLDMNCEFDLKIDELYNPLNIKERTSITYEIIRNRSKLLANNKCKFSELLNIINKNRDKKILIINKYGEFANEVTDYINKTYGSIRCMNYHDKVEPIPAIDDNLKPVYIKSGDKKGERKMIGAKAQRTLATKLFNNDVINILSTNNAPDKDLCIDVDIIIITSPLCKPISSYIYRLLNVNFRNQNIKLYTLYCSNTIEEQKLNKTGNKNHIINKYSTNGELCQFSVED